LDDKYTTKEQLAELQKELNEARAQAASKGTGNARGSKASRIAGWIVFIVVFAALSMILASVLVAKSSGKTPSVFGYQLYVVQSGSMIPTFNIGTVILSKTPDDPSALKKGNIITFENDGMTVTHRIIEVVTEGGIVKYRTKGDNPENSPDEGFRTVDKIKAVFVFRIPLT
jgi:signal peptidase I